MAAVHKPKASDKQAALKKVLAALKKHYKGSPPKNSRPVLENMLYAVCLENASTARADECYDRITAEFHDLNEIRVSSVSEIERVFAGMDDADWRAFRLRSILQFVFEKSFDYEYGSLKKKTLELATKQLAQINPLSPFIRSYTLHAALGAHLVPVDEKTARVLVWLGLADPSESLEEISESLKPVVRKADGDMFSHLIRCLATDPAFEESFDPRKHPPSAEHCDPATAAERLANLLSSSGKKRAAAKRTVKATNKKKTPSASRKKAAERKATQKRTSKKTNRKPKASSSK